MLNYKSFYLWLLLLLCIGCSPTKHNFNYADIINNSIQQDAYILSDYASKQKDIKYNNITAYRIYRATLKEALVENNSVGEYKLINTASQQNTVNKAVTGNYHELYLYLLNIDSGLAKKFALVSTGYNPQGECISLGPAYVGSINTGKSNPSLQVEYAVDIKKGKDGLYLHNNYKNKIDINFLSHKPIMPDNNSENLLQFYMVLQNSKNKIGGMNKPLVYNIAKVFNDSAAMIFTLLTEKK